MRHRVMGRHLGRDTAHRKALFSNLVRDLYIHGRITTTEAKARAIRADAEKLITKAWYQGKVQVEVRSDGGRVIRPRSHNSDGG